MQQWLKIEDPRDEKKVKYPLRYLIFLGILMFVCKLGSRRQIKFDFKTDNFLSKLNFLAKTKIFDLAHPDTLAYLLKKIPYEILEDIKTKMIRTLIRKKCFVNWRLLDTYYLVAIDGTESLSFSKRHCPHCMTRKSSNGKIKYYHPILEAKLVISTGIVLSIATEFIENIDPNASKQDCELKAFYRLEKKIKQNFPQLKICLLLDSLYAAEPVFDICKTNKWEYIINFKEGSIPTVYQEFEALKKLKDKKYFGKGIFEKNKAYQKYEWLNAIPYNKHSLNILECIETDPAKKKSKGIEKTKFVWITNLDINKNNYHKIANQGGRARWKIENEGFNIQKNGGYNLKHAYSKNLNTAKNFYILMQIAHCINQLMETGSLLKNQIPKFFGSIKNIARRLLEELRYLVIPEHELLTYLDLPCQIRFNSS